MSASPPAPPLPAFRPPLWQRTGSAWLNQHLQTIWPAWLYRQRRTQYQRQRLSLAHGETAIIDSIPASAAHTPLLVLWHGLEGSSQSHYAQRLARAFARQGWMVAIAHFRGCAGETTAHRYAYHAADGAWIQATMQALQAAHPGRAIYVVGVSLGGNAMLHWLAERPTGIVAAAGVSIPWHLDESAQRLRHGWNRKVYTEYFLQSLRQRLQNRQDWLKQLGLTVADVAAMRDFHDFDELVTAPLHGFASAQDYWQRAHALHKLAQMAVPCLFIHAQNDPFLPLTQTLSPNTALLQWDLQAQGGHAGFYGGAQDDWLAQRLWQFFTLQAAK